ncbi:hypothetical protein VSU19_00045, partial [Verrucomicrobiales bacterium BCK34]|nr:hypothetical protein [Verrucomicrobiales bacterium BCK34]
LAHGNVEFSAGIQNSSSGDVTVIAGWNGSQYTAGAPGTAETGNVTFSDFINNPVSYGNASGGATGAVIIGDGTQSSGIAVGSRDGVTSVAANTVALRGGDTGGNGDNVYAQIGFAGAGTGNLNVHAKDSISLQGGAKYDRAHAQIGHGGYIMTGDRSGDIFVEAGNGVTLTADQTGTGRFGSARIGHGGRGHVSGNNMSGSITVNGGAGAVSLIAGQTEGLQPFRDAQIGHGGSHDDIGNFSGAIRVTGDEVNLDAGHWSTNYAAIGHGGSTSGTNTGDRSGDIYVGTPGEISLEKSASGEARIGHFNQDAAGVISNANVTIEAGSMDATVGDAAGTTYEVGSVFGDILQRNLLAGDVTLHATGAGGISMNTAGTIAYDAPNDFNVFSDRDVNIIGSIQNSGAGNINLVAGWNSTTAPLADPLTGIIANVDMTTDIFDVAGSFGNNNGSVLLSNPSGVSGVGALNGATNVAGYNVTLTGTSGGFAQIGYAGTGDGEGDITVRAVEAVSLTGGDKYDNAHAQIGHGGYQVAGDKGGDISVEAGNGVTLTADQSGTGRFAAAQIGHGGRGVHPSNPRSNNYSGSVTVDGGAGAVSLSAALASGGQDFRHVQIGHGWSHDAYGDFSGNIVVNGSEVNIAGGAQNSSYARVGHGGLVSGDNTGTRTGDIFVGTPGEISIESGTAVAVIGHHNEDAAGTISGANVTLEAASIDEEVGDAFGTEMTLSAALGSMIASNLAAGDVSLHATGADGLSIGAFSFNSGNDFNLLSENDVTVSGIVRNTGAGNMNLVAGWDPTVVGAELADPVTGIIADIDMATEIFGVAGSYGNNNGSLVVTNAAGSAGFGTLSGTTNVAAYDVTLTGTDSGYAQIGYEGAGSGNISVYAANAVSLAGGSQYNNAHAQIGHGGYILTGNRSGNIMVDAGNGVTLTADQVGGGRFATARIGHGGRGHSTGNDMSGSITVNGGAGAVNLTAGLTSGSEDFRAAQIGHGGAHDDIGNFSGDIRVSGSEVNLHGGSRSASYAAIGHGGSTSGTNTGNRSGDIYVGADDEISIERSGSGAARIGHHNEDAVGVISNADVTIEADSLDTTVGDVFSGDFDMNSTLVSMVLTNLEGGDVTLHSRGFGGIQMNSSAEMVYDSENDFTLLSDYDVSFNGLFQNAGAGNFNVIAGWDSGAAPLGDPLTGIIADVDIATDILGVANSYGNNFATITVGGSGNAFSTIVGSRMGRTDVLGYEVTLNGGSATNSYSQIGYRLTSSGQAASGGIGVAANAGGLTLNAGTGESYAQIGHGGRSTKGAISDADIDINVIGTIDLNSGTGTFGYTQIGHGGSNSVNNPTTVSNSDIRVNELAGTGQGDINLLAGGSNATAQIGHGGAKNDATQGFSAKSGDITIFQAANITLAGGEVDGSAQIGHGGDGGTGVVGSTPAGDVSGDISVTASGFIRVLGGESSGYAQIGHGSDANRGDIDANITVNAGGTLEVKAGTGVNSYAQIGNGGYNATGEHTGSIEVQANLVDMVANTNAGSFAQIGHGGANSGAYLRNGEICVHGVNGVNLSAQGTGSFSRSYTQIGHGGTTTDGTLGGDIRVTASNGGVSLLGGNSGSGSQYAQIGHGGVSSDGAMSGDIYVIAGNGDTVLTGGSTSNSYAMIGHGDSGGATTTGTREGGIHLFSSGSLTGTNGTGTDSQINIYHQTGSAGGLASNYLGGDGFQLVANGGVNLLDSVLDEIDVMVNRNFQGGVISLALANDIDFTLDGSGGTVDTSSDFYLLTGGNITVANSFQNIGDGDVTLVAGWNGSGFSATGSVDYGSPIDFCAPMIIADGELDPVDFNCASFGVGGAVLTIGDTGQTDSLAIGSRGGVNTFAGAGIVVNAGGSAANASTQLGFRPTAGSQGAVGAINLYVKSGGLDLNSGDFSNSFTQIGHGGTGSSSNNHDAAITISFCEVGEVNLNAGDGNGSYSQIGHGGVSAGGTRGGEIQIVGAAGTAAKAGNISLVAGGNTNAYAKIGHGGFGGNGATQGSIRLDSAGKVDLLGGSALDANAQIGNGGKNNNTSHGVVGDQIVVLADQGIALTGGTTSGSTTYGAFAQIGNAGYDADGVATGDIFLNFDPTIGANGSAVGGGDLVLNGGNGVVGTYAQVGHGGRNQEGANSGAIKLGNVGDVSLGAGAGGNYVQIGHGGNGTSTGAKDGDIDILNANSISITGGSGDDAYAQIGHGGRSANGNTSGSIRLTSANAVSIQGGAASHAFAMIGNGGDANKGDHGLDTDQIIVNAGGGISLTAGAGGVAGVFAQIGNGGYESDGIARGDIFLNFDPAIGANGAAVGGGDIVLNDGSGGIGSYTQIGHGGRLHEGLKSGDITLGNAGNVELNAGLYRNYSMIGHGGNGIDVALANDVSGSIKITNAASVLLDAGDEEAFAQIGHGGYGYKANLGTAGDVLEITSSGAVTVEGGNGVSAYAQIGNGGRDSDGNHTSDISITAGSVELDAGNVDNAYAKIGLGGHDTTGTQVGSISVTATTGGVSVLGADGGSNSLAQIGHGGRSSGGTKNGSITVLAQGADSDVIVEGGDGNEALAVIGHGGTSSPGDIGLSTDLIRVEATRDVIVKAGEKNNTLAQIGNGGLASGGTKRADISVIAGRDVLVEAGTVGGDDAYAMIGHGGAQTATTTSGSITVKAGRSVEVTGGTNLTPTTSGVDTPNFAQIGHGGDDNTGSHGVTGDRIEVSADFITLTSGTGNGTYAQIGMGGNNAGGNLTGDVCVHAESGIILNSAAAIAVDSYTQIGNGGNASGNSSSNVFEGDVVVTAGAAGIQLIGGDDPSLAGATQYAQIGHGGVNTTATMNGDVYVIADDGGDITLTSGDRASSYAMIGHGDAEGLTSYGRREGGVHILATGQLTASNGTGIENVNIYHQTGSAGGLAANYDGGDGFQILSNAVGGPVLPNSAVDDMAAMVNGNTHVGSPVQVIINNTNDYVFSGTDYNINTGDDFFIVTGGNITVLDSYQNEGFGDVVLVAGWDGTGAVTNWSVDFPTVNGEIDFCHPSIGSNLEFDFNNCESFGVGGKTVTIGSANQTQAVQIGTRQGTTYIGAHKLIVQGSTIASDAESQIGFYGNGSGDMTGATKIFLHEGGLELNGGTTRSFAQIGHGGIGSTSGNSTAVATIDITFCDPGAVMLNGGTGTDAYAQIGHGGRGVGGDRAGAITIGGRDIASGAGVIQLKGGNGQHSYAQIGHGGLGGSGDAGGDISLRSMDVVSLIGGTRQDAYSQVGHGGHDHNTTVLGALSDKTVVIAENGISLSGGNTVGTEYGAYASIGNGGYDADAELYGDIFINYNPDTATAVGGGDITLIASTKTASDPNYGTIAQIGHGGRNQTGATQGDIIVGKADAVTVQATQNRSYAQIGHGGNDSSTAENGAMSGSIRILESTSVDVLGGTGVEGAYAQIGHGGHKERGDFGAAGDLIEVKSSGAITVKAGTVIGAFAQIGNGGWDADGNHRGSINVSGASVLVQGGGTDVQAQIGHGGYSTTGDMGFTGEEVKVTASGAVEVKGGTGARSFAIIGNGGRGASGTLDSDVVVNAGSILLEAGSAAEATAQIGHGGVASNISVSGNLDIDSADFITLASSSSVGAYTQIGHGGVYGSFNATNAKIDLDAVGAISLTASGDNAYSQIGHGGSQVFNLTATNSAITINRIAGSGTGAITLQGATGANAAAMIGHGGVRDNGTRATGLMDIEGDILIENSASVSVLGGSGADSLAKIGHGGEGVIGEFVGDIRVESQGAVKLAAGSGNTTTAQIGHLGHDSEGAATGDVIVIGSAIDLDAGAAGDYTFAQIGHGGAVKTSTTKVVDPAANSLSGDIFINWDPTLNGGAGGVAGGAGAITMNSGSTARYTQIGHGGYLRRATDVTGAIKVGRAASLELVGGTGTDAYSQVGHGGGWTNFSGAVTNADITLDILGKIDVLAGGGAQAYAQIGHAGFNTMTTAVTDVDIMINTASGTGTGDVRVLGAGTNSYGQIGHGGARSDGNQNSADKSGNITLGNAANITVAAGRNTDGYAQIGHGGEGGLGNGTTGDLAGAIDLTTTGNVVLTGGTAAGDDIYAQIGHGGDNSRGDAGGFICVKAGGNVELTAGDVQKDSYVQIGHGGVDSNGDRSGAVSVVAGFDGSGNLILTGGDDTGQHAQIGHGGTDNGTSEMSGDITVLVNGNFAANGGSTGAENYAMVGHGDAAPGTAGDRSGDVKIAVSGGTVLTDNGSSVRLGHGTSSGVVSNSEFVLVSGILDTTGNALGVSGIADVMGEGGDVSFAVLGGDLLIDGAGAFNNSAFHSNFAAAGNVDVFASIQNAGGGQVNVASGWASSVGFDPGASEFDGSNGLLLDLDFTNCPQIATLEFDFSTVAADSALWGAAGSVVTVGSAGQSVSFGSAGGETNVLADGVVLQGSDTSDYAHAQLGYFGSGVDMTGNINLLGGDGGLSVLGGDAAGAFAQVGHGGLGSANADIVNANITVSFSDSSALALSAGGGQSAYSQIGHGGESQTGAKSGWVTLTGGSLVLEGGGGSDAAARLGNGGSRSSGDISGDVSVVAKTGNVEIKGGSGAFSEAAIGSGGIQYTATSIASATTVTSPLDIILSGGTGVQASAQIGAGGLEAAADNITGDVFVDAENDITLTSGMDIRAFSQIGNGGATASGDFSGKIEVEAANSIYLTAVNGAFGSYAKIGHGDDLFSPLSAIGSLSGSGAREGDIEVSAGLNLVSFDSMIGHVNDATGATATGGSTQIAVSTSAPKDPLVGSIVADSDSEFSGAEDVRFYLPGRSNNDVEAGALINGEA